MNEVEILTGKGCLVVPDGSIVGMVRAKVSIARGDSPKHVIRYSPGLEGELDYLVAHELGHIKRIYEAPEESRLLPAVSRAHRELVFSELQYQFEKFRQMGMPMFAWEELVDMWHQGIVSQLANYPSDMRIERWMRGSYFGLRENQEKALRDQVKANAQSLAPRIRRFTPEKIYHASNTMNSAFAFYVSMLLDDGHLTEAYGGTRYYLTGKELAIEVWNKEDKGYVSDLEHVYSWAKLFGLDGWFGWRNLTLLLR